MTEQARTYGTVLFELDLPGEMIEKAFGVLSDNPVLIKCLISPEILLGSKLAVIQKVFREPEFSPLMTRFLEKVCENSCMDQMEEIFQVWKEKTMEAAGILSASLYCVTLPDEKEREGMRAFLSRKFGAKEVRLTIVNAPELMGGFVLKAKDMEYDYSLKGQLTRLARAVAG